MLTLYHFPTSTCSQKVRLSLAEKGLEWTSRIVDLYKGEQLEDWYLRINPNGVVPTLVHDDDPITDSAVIIEYLEDVFSTVPLRPIDPVACARMRVWRQFIEEVPVGAIRFPAIDALIKRGGTMLTDMSDAEFADYLATRPLKAALYQRLTRTGFGQADMEIAHKQLRLALERMDAALAHGPWLNGQDFSLADISVIPTVARMEDLSLAHLWSDLPRMSDWYARVQARPSFDAAFYQGARQNQKPR